MALIKSSGTQNPVQGLGSYWGYITVKNEVTLGYIRDILKLYWGYIGIMVK